LKVEDGGRMGERKVLIENYSLKTLKQQEAVRKVS
jgi:hypothetical protein